MVKQQQQRGQQNSAGLAHVAAGNGKKKLLDRAYDALRQAGWDHSTAQDGVSYMRGYKQVQELLGHKDIRTTMIYLHAMEGGTTSVISPLDTLESPMGENLV